MTRGDILARLQGVAVETFGCPAAAFQEATTAADIPKWDSLRHLIFISAVEQAFDIEFDMNRIAGLTRVGDLVSLIERTAAA